MPHGKELCCCQGEKGKFWLIRKTFSLFVRLYLAVVNKSELEDLKLTDIFDKVL